VNMLGYFADGWKNSCNCLAYTIISNLRQKNARSASASGIMVTVSYLLFLRMVMGVQQLMRLMPQGLMEEILI